MHTRHNNHHNKPFSKKGLSLLFMNVNVCVNTNSWLFLRTNCSLLWLLCFYILLHSIRSNKSWTTKDDVFYKKLTAKQQKHKIRQQLNNDAWCDDWWLDWVMVKRRATQHWKFKKHEKNNITKLYMTNCCCNYLQRLNCLFQCSYYMLNIWHTHNMFKNQYIGSTFLYGLFVRLRHRQISPLLIFHKISFKVFSLFFLSL